MKQTPVLIGKKIGDNLDLEIEGTYPCSDGGLTTTISVDKLLEAQRDASDRNRDKQWIEWLLENNEAVNPEKALLITVQSGNLQALQKLAEECDEQTG